MVPQVRTAPLVSEAAGRDRLGRVCPCPAPGEGGACRRAWQSRPTQASSEASALSCRRLDVFSRKRRPARAGVLILPLSASRSG